jgi:hypothetical protein
MLTMLRYMLKVVRRDYLIFMVTLRLPFILGWQTIRSNGNFRANRMKIFL